MALEAYIYLISGRVQGVGFRWFTEREARKRQVTGFVRNLRDGRVEVLAQADAEVLRDLEERLRRGPAVAKVSDLERRSVPVDEGLSAFRVRHDGDPEDANFS